MRKSEKFYEILRNAGITEYWVLYDFDLDADYPSGNILLNTSDSKLLGELFALYNDFDDVEEKCNTIIRGFEDDFTFKHAVEIGGYKRRFVKAEIEKSEKFYEILRNAGITEYWASEDFNPDASVAGSRLIIPTDSVEIVGEIDDVYSNDEDIEKFGYSVIIEFAIKDSELFSILLNTGKNVERRIL